MQSSWRTLDGQRAELVPNPCPSVPGAQTKPWIMIGAARAFRPKRFAARILISRPPRSLARCSRHFPAKIGWTENTRRMVRPALFSSCADKAAVFAIAIPFFLLESTSLLRTAGNLVQVIRLPVSWIHQQRPDLFPGTRRTVLVLALWHPILPGSAWPFCNHCRHLSGDELPPGKAAATVIRALAAHPFLDNAKNRVHKGKLMAGDISWCCGVF